MKRKHKQIVKQRNRFVVLAKFRKAGPHRKPFKALRKLENQRVLNSDG